MSEAKGNKWQKANLYRNVKYHLPGAKDNNVFKLNF